MYEPWTWVADRTSNTTKILDGKGKILAIVPGEDNESKAKMIVAMMNGCGEHRAKWINYENEYILPCFELAKKAGIDLHRLVREKAGKNCVILLVEELLGMINQIKMINNQGETDGHK